MAIAVAPASGGTKAVTSHGTVLAKDRSHRALVTALPSDGEEPDDD